MTEGEQELAEVSVRSVGKDALLYVPGRIIPAIVQILTVPVLTSFFASDEFGRFNLAFRFILFLSTFTILWLNMAVLRFYAASAVRDEEDLFFGVIGLIKYCAIAVGLFLGILAYVFGPSRLFGSYRELIGVGLVVFVTYSIYEVGLSVLRAKRKPLTYSVATTINAGLRLPLAVGFFLWLKTGVSGMLWSMAIMYAVSHVLVVARHIGRARWRLSEREKELLAEVLRYGLPIWLTHVLFFLIMNADLYLIKVLQGAAGDTQAGLYSAVTTLIDQPMMIVFNTFSMAVFPSVAAAWEFQGRASTEDLVKGVTRMFFVLCIPLMALLGVLAYPVFQVLARGDTWQAYVAAPWIAAASFLFGLSYFASFGLHLAKKTVPLLWMTVLALVANVGLNLALIPMHGFVGAGMARLLSNGILVVAIAAAGHRYFRWRFPFASLFRVSLAAAVSGLAVYCLKGWLPENVFTLGLLFLAGGGLCLLGLVLLREIPMSLLRQALRRLGILRAPT